MDKSLRQRLKRLERAAEERAWIAHYERAARFLHERGKRTGNEKDIQGAAGLAASAKALRETALPAIPFRKCQEMREMAEVFARQHELPKRVDAPKTPHDLLVWMATIDAHSLAAWFLSDDEYPMILHAQIPGEKERLQMPFWERYRHYQARRQAWDTI